MTDLYRALGVRTVVNAAGTLTRLGGSRMAPEVLAAMAEASRAYVRIEDLQEAAGRVIAEATGAETGYVTSGAAAGLLLGTAACVAGLDLQKMERLPETSAPGTKNEVVIHRVHRNSYDHAIRATGITFVEVGHFGHPSPGPTRPYELASAINDRTAMVFWPVMGDPEGLGVLSLEETVRVAHRRGVPVLVDAAAALPPASNLRRLIAEGADLVTFSGGKALGGPQSSGILAGRADLIRSVALQHQDMDVHPGTWTWRHLIAEGQIPGPPLQGIGRACKVGREEIAGLLTALRRYLERDHAADVRRWRRLAQRMAEGLAGLPGVTATYHDGGERGTASVQIHLDERVVGSTAVQVINTLAEGDPIVAVGQGGVDQGFFTLGMMCLADGEEEIVIARLREVIAGG
ncbi:MAG: aminotransferase class V-fold PLP-dependent enzyme [Chloroflexota bacterium]